MPLTRRSCDCWDSVGSADLTLFYWLRRERNILQIGTMYDKTFVTLTERFYKNVPWPPVELLAPLVDHDHVFCMLYKVSLRIWLKGMLLMVRM